jgi:hypothetical protein
MTHIEQAIKQAVEKGGWIPTGIEAHKITGWELDDGVLKVMGTYNKIKAVTDYVLVEQILLDPSFWQALGKARGWGIEPSGSISQGQAQWLIYWHHFIDHLAAGKDAESFFATLV